MTELIEHINLVVVVALLIVAACVAVAVTGIFLAVVFVSVGIGAWFLGIMRKDREYRVISRRMITYATTSVVVAMINAFVAWLIFSVL